MSSITLEICDTADMSPDMWRTAARIFSDNYGVWSVSSPSPRPGARIKMSTTKLQGQLIPARGADSVYVRAMSGDQVAGHVFASRWDYQGRKVAWITQLVVDSNFRRREIATKLIAKLREGHADDRSFGILSSHPAAIRATLRAFGRGLDDVNLDMIKQHARSIMASSPVGYVKTAALHGSLFEAVQDGSVSSAFTQFFVDHQEPLEALKEVRDRGIAWPLGELLEGHEFLLLVEADEQELSEF